MAPRMAMKHFPMWGFTPPTTFSIIHPSFMNPNQRLLYRTVTDNNKVNAWTCSLIARQDEWTITIRISKRSKTPQHKKRTGVFGGAAPPRYSPGNLLTLPITSSSYIFLLRLPGFALIAPAPCSGSSGSGGAGGRARSSPVQLQTPSRRGACLIPPWAGGRRVGLSRRPS